MTLSTWFNSLFARSAAPSVGTPGTQVLATGAQALASVESACCDAVCGTQIAAPASLNALGQSVTAHLGSSDVATLDLALGLTLTGRRATAFVGGENLPALGDRLGVAAGRRAPLVVHAELTAPARQSATRGTGHDGYHAVADTGALLALARDAQHAIDLSLLARRVAELSLTPCVVAVDSLETAHGLQELRLPEGALLRDFLGAPGDELECPTPGQRLVFGQRRRQLPAWFDPNRPTTLGVEGAAATHAAGLAGQRLFFESHVEAILRDAAEALSQRTGRALPLVHEVQLKGAKHVLVAQGSLLEQAEAVADHARSSGHKVGVLGIVWLRPLPAAQIRAALAGAESVTVLERAESHLGGEPPLLREIRAALGGSGPRLRSALVGGAGAPVNAADLLAIAVEPGTSPRSHLATGAPLATATSSFPKREALLQAVKKGYPGADRALVSGPAVDLRPKGARTVALCLHAGAPEDERLVTLGTVVAAAAGTPVRGRWVQGGVQAWTARLTASASGRDAADDAPVDLVVVDSLEAAVRQPPPAVLRQGAAVVVHSAAPGLDLWQRLPPAWQQAVRGCTGRLFVAPVAPLAAATLEALWSAEKSGLLEIGWAKAPATSAATPELPAAVRRIGQARAEVDSLPRYFGELVQPQLQGEVGAAVPEPHLALAAAPAGAAAFGPARSPGLVPVVNADTCTGCGQCWVACPDSALGVVALTADALLNAAAARAAVRTPQADKLKRAHKQLAARIDTQLTERQAHVVTADAFREALDGQLSKLKASKDEEPAYREALEASLAQVAGAFPLCATQTFHAAPHRELLLLAVDMRACQSCGGCAAVCPEQAITLVPPTPERVAAEAARWTAWERLPDTAGDTIARVAKLDEVGPLAAALMSRHCLGALPGGDHAEPGSGARLALRHLAATTEYELQRRLGEQGERLLELAGQLREKLKDVLAQGLPGADLVALRQALAGGGKRAPLAEVLTRVTATPTSPTFDATAALRLAELVPTLEALHAQWTHGVDGLGRARMAVVVAGTHEGWLAGFPGSAPFAPVLVDSLAGSSVVAGLAQGLLAQTVAEYRAVRAAELALEAPPDIELKLQHLATLSSDELPAEAWATCPPLLLLAHVDTLGPQGLAAIFELLGSKLPVKVVLLDALDATAGRPDATLFALAQRQAFVLATSVAHGAHLFDGVKAALAHRGPALIHLHAPSPTGDGYPADATVARARGAVESRAHPLVRYDPGAPGVFGSRLDLAGNPDVTSAWTSAPEAPRTPLHWALGDGTGLARSQPATPESMPVEQWLKLEPAARAAQPPSCDAPDGKPRSAGPELAAWVSEREQRWAIVRELAGVTSPFTSKIKADLQRDLEAAHLAQVAALEAAHAGQMATLERGYREKVAGELKARLLALSAQPPRGEPPRKPEGKPA